MCSNSFVLVKIDFGLFFSSIHHAINADATITKKITKLNKRILIQIEIH